MTADAAAAVAAAAAFTLPVFRLPTEPYPGLRPFLDHESALLFGRARQVKEVIEHLRETQFVAVIGGSGSGKSSLIHAGVVPELRSFGIPGAGDFWIPMVCTPGTNPRPIKPATGKQNAGTNDSAAPPRVYTPITRLAWKFARLLNSRGTPEADAKRLDDIAAVFRQDAGFARLVDAYADELAVPPGPDASEARLLFVIDQFEELFHPTNKDSDDARLMVERVIDHFFNPHARCHLVLTMRSEHLNDCASYLELPDAINRSSYLVRRLDPSELREAIVAPAQRFLRLLQRQRSVEAASLPEQVEFEAPVLDRLLADVQAITHDPDHLPLLQHLLARLWEMACRREGAVADANALAAAAAGAAAASATPACVVPARITAADLLHAVLAANPGEAAANAEPEPALDDRQNVLRASLDNWAEAIFRRRKSREQKQLEALLRRLAFKDPNTGMYTQQRVDVDDPRLFDDAANTCTRAALHALIEDPVHGRGGQFGFIGSVDYLFWDDENPQRVTLKVSHESFIRGWSRFRSLVDKEAERFDAFVDLLQRCARWSVAKQPERLLLEPAELDRIDDERLPAVLADARERASWFKVLRLDRDGPRLAPHEAEIDAFIDQSRQRQRGTARRAGVVKASLVVTGVLALLFAPFLVFSVFVQSPVKERAELFFDATALADQARQANSYYAVGEAAQPLRALLAAADKVVEGRSESTHKGMKGWQYRFSAWVLEQLEEFPFVRAQAQFLDKVAGQSEPRVNGQLRLLLTSALWQGGAPNPAAALPAPARNPAASCSIVDGDSSDPSPPSAVQATGRLFMRSDRLGEVQQRGIFIPNETQAHRDELVLLGALVDTAAGTCSTIDLLPVPRALNPAVLFDANMTHLLVATEDALRQSRAVTFYDIDWQLMRGGRGWRTEVRQRAVVTDPAAYDLVRAQAGSGDVKADAVASWHALGGDEFQVGAQRWRLLSVVAQAPELAVASAAPNADAAEVSGAGTEDRSADWQALVPAAPGSACAQLGTLLLAGAQREFTLSSSLMFEFDKHCFDIRRGSPKLRAGTGPTGTGPTGTGPTGAAPVPPPPAAEAMQFEDTLVAVYDKPNPLDVAEPGYAARAPIASLPQFGRFGRTQNRWFVGKPKGRYDGWVALLHPTGQRLLHFGAPWSTAALVRLGREIEAEQPKPAPVGGFSSVGSTETFGMAGPVARTP